MRQLIIGPPGTGKTYYLQKLAKHYSELMIRSIVISYEDDIRKTASYYKAVRRVDFAESLEAVHRSLANNIARGIRREVLLIDGIDSSGLDIFDADKVAAYLRMADGLADNVFITKRSKYLPNEEGEEMAGTTYFKVWADSIIYVAKQR